MAQLTSLATVYEEDLYNVVLVKTSAGACLRGHVRRKECHMAIKLFQGRTSHDSNWKERLRDAELLAKLRSERVLAPWGLHRACSLVGLVWDWMPEGSLHSLLYETSLYPDIPMSLRTRILWDVAEGLLHMHGISQPHMALKATNVLLDQQYRAKLCDWGHWRDIKSSFSNGCGPCFRDLAYLSPEVIQGSMPSVEADMYSFGVLLWETLNRRRPSEGIDQLQILLLSAQEGVELGMEGDLLPQETPQIHALTQLMMRCLNTEPRQRPLASECVLELRKAMETFEPQASAKATIQLRMYKERALLSCKQRLTWEMPIEINNLEGYDVCRGQKTMITKVIPGDPLQTNVTKVPCCSDSQNVSPSVPTAVRASPNATCCRDAERILAPTSGSLSASYSGCGLWKGDIDWTTPHMRNPSYNSSSVMLKSSLQRPRVSSPAVCQMPDTVGWSCGRLLQERRETIVRYMTEGRLNNLLDVLRARRAVTREAYEQIMADLTLAARTRSLLDTCACLGENVAALVATTLGLVSVERSRGRIQLVP
ncbi:receptor-interacting serine/threonine-protein kinase 2 [Chanos chanos]|uniref:Receptor-interacting serine/threonine-protein kinase 2 n=1 Tax=Chanos chanos TaxID=29144 RepID=A0A6J2UPK3_CHACN|nr:receptor-interacting serine/threonine-protein kinase 2-like [Chanos chanos]